MATMMNDPFEIARELDSIRDWVNGWMNGDWASRGWAAQPGSPMVGDDRATRPHQTSHAAGAAINAALDQLHGLMALVSPVAPAQGPRWLHTKAPFSLARATIENASIAYWLVSPPARIERVHRTLRLHVADVVDGMNALDDLGATARIDRGQRIAELKALASAAGVPDTGRGWAKFTSSEAVRSIDVALDNGIKPGPMGAWRLFSGFAHARPWATAAFLDRETAPGGLPDENLLKVRHVNSPVRILFAASMAQDVVAKAIETYIRRATPPSA